MKVCDKKYLIYDINLVNEAISQQWTGKRSLTITKCWTVKRPTYVLDFQVFDLAPDLGGHVCKIMHWVSSCCWPSAL